MSEFEESFMAVLGLCKFVRPEIGDSLEVSRFKDIIGIVARPETVIIKELILDGRSATYKHQYSEEVVYVNTERTAVNLYFDQHSRPQSQIIGPGGVGVVPSCCWHIVANIGESPAIVIMIVSGYKPGVNWAMPD